MSKQWQQQTMMKKFPEVVKLNRRVYKMLIHFYLYIRSTHTHECIAYLNGLFVAGVYLPYERNGDDRKKRGRRKTFRMYKRILL